MAEHSLAESGSAKAEAPTEARLDVPAQAPEPDAAADAAISVLGPMAPADMPAALATPVKAEIFGVGASAVGHLLIGLLIIGSLASAQKPPEAIPVKLIPADQVPQTPKMPPQPQPETAKAAAPEEKAPPPPKTAEKVPAQTEPPPRDAAEKGSAKSPSDAAKPPPAAQADSAEKKSMPWRDVASSLAIADYGRKTTLPDTLLAELSAEVKRCWTIPAGWTDPRQAAVTLRFLLRRDGTLDGDPAVVEFPATPVGAAAAKAAIAAVTQCGPFHLPAEQYEQWKDIQLKLTP